MSTPDLQPRSAHLPRPRPPSSARVALLITSLAARRTLNQWAGKWRRPVEGARGGTARKRAPAKMLLGFVAVVFAMQVITTTTQIVYGVAHEAEVHDHPGVELVSQDTIDGIDWVLARDPAKVDPGLSERSQLRRMFELDDELESHGPERAERLTQVFERRGRAGFRASMVEHTPWPSTSLWYRGGDPLAMLGPLALIGSLLALAVTFFCVVGPDRELSARESTLEWWFTFPVSARGLLLSRVIETALVSPMIWVLLLPFFAVVFWCAGLGGWGVALALPAAVYLGLLAGSLRVLTETVLRRLLSSRALSLVQAVLQLTGSLLLVVPFTATSRVGLRILVARAHALPSWFAYNPLALPLHWLRGATTTVLAFTGCALVLALALLGALALGSHMLRDGLLGSPGPRQSTRGPSPRRQYAAVPWLGVVARTELTSVLRDPTRVMRVLVTPLLAIGFQGLFNPTFFRSLVTKPQHAAATTFGLSALMLVGGALPSLAIEAPALWLTHGAPRSLDRVLLQKAAFWSTLVTLFAALTLGVLALLTGNPQLVLSGHAALALLGVALYGFIAMALAVLGTDVHESELRRRLPTTSVQLFMLLTALFSYALYVPSLWAKFAQLSLSVLLAFALWQKVRDHTPYLLDPTEAPPPRIAVSDGIFAALAFFVLQGLLTLLLSLFELPSGLSLVFAFVGAGLVVTVGALVIFSRSGVPALSLTLGLGFAEGRPLRAVVEGLLAGLAAGALSIVYGVTLQRVPWLRELSRDAEHLDPSAELLPWLCGLAVLAAPLFEEFIFRGVLYRGFRRSLSPLQAALGSSLVFALVHPPLAFVPVFAMALLAATVFERSRLLLAPMVTHMTYNAIVVAVALAAQTRA